MPSKDVLKEAIKAFDGTAIIVSHDREFLDGLVSKVYEFGGGRCASTSAAYTTGCRARMPTASTRPSAGNSPPHRHNPPPATTKSHQPGKQNYLEHKAQQKKLRKAQRDVQECERKIATMEKRVKELDALFMKPENAANMELVTEYTTLKPGT